MTGDGSKDYQQNVLLLSAVKILSDYGLNKTLKKLRKETNCNHGTESTPIKKVKKTKEDSGVLPGFVRSEVLEGTIETLKTDHPITHTGIEDSDTSGDEKNKEISSTHGVKSGVPFKRINEEIWLSKIEKEELKNNTYRAKGDSFALKDAEQLSLVKGKDFRSQKYKKKRSSWKGSGEITNTVNSVIFSDSDS
ncbi:uncharacterized protein TOT_030000177 [Theileria orientalis strain Shintoku]|uniref:Srp40 C-terminal domain-containing protein n=1 Tax=Theileria orientalis strain Shintoku TaxID=869250 RepID=J4C3R8_THEOR|nr:uncharacterized protein TOT_030000177 [Theileria orientalis strain Shintoku]BAM40916.1 uncharacterized protein TOT_030000177 [Theileria orientalis strain Shintoku]|eukprot:XP_009691217.1 uncharacterized protein TOT_030000177 [Theileria orientalis strain Shintoku]